METHTLLLTTQYYPHRIVHWHDSMIMLVTGDIETVAPYEDVVIRTPTVGFQLPAVAKLVRPVASYKKGVKFSRINVMTRDEFACQYCGRRLPMKELNYDHVVPRIQGGRTVWENIATACYPCNDRKAGRTPEQAGMRLRRKPFRPKTLPMTPPLWPLNRVPDAWRPYLSEHFLGVLATG